jgi:hypothetical protein
MPTRVSRKMMTNCPCPYPSKKEKPWLILFTLVALLCLYILVWEVVSIATSDNPSKHTIPFFGPRSHVAFIRGGGKDVPISVLGTKIRPRTYESLVSECLSDDITDIQNPLAMKSVGTLDECKALCDAFGSEKCAGFTLMLGPTFKLCDLKRSCDGIVDENIDCIASMNLAKQNRQFKKIQGCGYRAK